MGSHPGAFAEIEWVIKINRAEMQLCPLHCLVTSSLLRTDTKTCHSTRVSRAVLPAISTTLSSKGAMAYLKMELSGQTLHSM